MILTWKDGQDILDILFLKGVHISLLALCTKMFWKDWQKSLEVGVDIGVGEGGIFKNKLFYTI